MSAFRFATGALALLFATAATAAPRANSTDECVLFADIALVTATLAKHGITREQAERMLPDMYDLRTEDAREITQRILDTAYEPMRVEPQVFSRALANTCVSRGGAMEAVLGVKL